MDKKINPKKNPQKYHGYMKRIKKRIDEIGIPNLLWLAEHFPEILRDLKTELADENLPMKRRAKALIKAVTLFEDEATVLCLVAEAYSDHNIELTKS